jgi:hypothetical protein
VMLVEILENGRSLETFGTGKRRPLRKAAATIAVELAEYSEGGAG